MAGELSMSKCRRILEDLGSSANWTVEALLKHPIVSSGERDRMRNANLAIAQRAIDAGVKILDQDQLPTLLKQSPGGPVSLFAWGDESCLEEPTIAIVGTREATTYGKAVAQKFAEAFAQAGVTVVSGGAFGIDAAAHKGALAGGGKTAAVFLTGIEKVYPSEHAGLFRKIRENGVLISQFAAGSGPGKYRPLQRNETVAALSLGVLVVEVPIRSGAITTAQAANNLGRQVFVVPANIDSESFRGSHALIRDGATLVDHPAQVLSALSIEPKTRIEDVREPANAVQEAILKALTTQPLAAEFIAERTGLESATVLAELTMLELDGLVVRDHGGYAAKP